MPADDHPLRPGALPELSASAQEMLDGLTVALRQRTDACPAHEHPATVFRVDRERSE